MVLDLSKIVDLSKITEINGYTITKGKSRTLYWRRDRVFLVVNKNTIELRCERQLAKTLRTRYESVMVSRYFGYGGIEIVPAGQLSTADLEDLVRLSYNLTQK